MAPASERVNQPVLPKHIVSFCLLIFALASAARAATPVSPAWTHGVGGFPNFAGVAQPIGSTLVVAGGQNLDTVDIATGASTRINSGFFAGQPSFNTNKTTMVVPTTNYFTVSTLTRFAYPSGNTVWGPVKMHSRNVAFSYYEGVFVGLTSHHSALSLVGISEATGTVLWNHTFENYGSTPVAPAIDRSTGVVFATDLNRTVYAIHALTGAQVWKNTQFSTTQQPSFCGGYVIVLSVDGVSALDRRTGAVVWQKTAVLAIITSVPAVCIDVPGSGPCALTTTSNGQLTSYVGSTGRVVFSTAPTTVGGSNMVSPLFDSARGLVYTFGIQLGGNVVTVGVVSSTTGKLKQQLSVSLPASGGGCTLVGTGTALWRTATGASRLLFSCPDIIAIDVGS